MGKRGKNKKGRKTRQTDWNNDDVEMGLQPLRKGQKGQKNQRAKKAKQNNKNFHLKKGILNSVIGEDDDGMGCDQDAPKIKKRGKELLKKLLIKSSGSDSAAGWHKITINEAAKFQKVDLLQAIAMNIDVPLAPICYEVKAKRDVAFYVERPNAAAAIKGLNNRPLTINGQAFKLTIKSKSSPPPQMTMNQEVRNVMKNVMGIRYKPDVKALDMKSFHTDQAFLGEAVYAPLARSAVMNNVIDIIGDNIPDVEAIDFSQNKLPTLEHFSTLADRAERLKILYLSNNRLSDVKELEKIKSLKLVELNVSGNANMEKKFNTREGFVNAIQNILPTLRILDGQELKKLITFDDGPDVEVPLPPTIKKMCKSEAAEPVILQFIQQYFKLYDNEDRSDLLAAYHPEALFSVSSAYPPGSTGHGLAKLTDYQSEARNLLRVVNPGKRLRLLRQGRDEIVSFLNELPKTKHDFNSFTLDVPLATEAVSSFTVTGVFVERTSTKTIVNSTRHFSRTFTLVSHGSGFVIVNESLFVTLATKLQIKVTLIGAIFILTKLFFTFTKGLNLEM